MSSLQKWPILDAEVIVVIQASESLSVCQHVKCPSQKLVLRKVSSHRVFGNEYCQLMACYTSQIIFSQTRQNKMSSFQRLDAKWDDP